MSKQVSDAQHAIDPIKIGSDAERADRDATSTALAASAAAMLRLAMSWTSITVR